MNTIDDMFTLQVNDDITLRHPEMRDALALFALFDENREHLTEWQDWPNKIQTLEDCEAFIQRHIQEYEDSKTLACLIVYQDTLVGMVDLTKIVPPLRKAEIGYWIAKGYEGKGIVTLSARALMVHAFEVMNINRLALKFKRMSDDHENWRSRRVSERLGFTQEGILRQDGMTKGVLMDMVMTSLLADEWRAMQEVEPTS